jgi:hypothetical protein
MNTLKNIIFHNHLFINMLLFFILMAQALNKAKQVINQLKFSIMKTTLEERGKPIRNYALAVYVIGVSTILTAYSLVMVIKTIY